MSIAVTRLHSAFAVLT